MDASLARRITQDWIDYRERLTTPNRLRSFLRLDTNLLDRLADSLRSYGHVFEYTRQSLAHLFHALARLARSSPRPAELSSLECSIRLAMYAQGVLHALVSGAVEPPVSEPPRAIANPGAAEIMSALDQVLALHPELAEHPDRQRLVEAYTQLQAEHAAFRRASPTLSDDDAPAFFTEFKHRIDTLTAEMASLLRSLLTNVPGKDPDRFPSPFPVEEALARVTSTLAQEICRARSLVTHALEEGWTHRDEILRFGEKRDPILALVNEQERILRHLSADWTRLAVWITENILDYVERARSGGR